MKPRSSTNRRWSSLVLVGVLYFLAATAAIAQQINIPMKVLKQFTLPGGSVVAGYEAQSILATGKGTIRLTGTNLAGCNPRHVGAYLYWVVIAEQQSTKFARVKFENTAVKGELIAKGTWSWVNPVNYYYIYRAEVTHLVSPKTKNGCWAFTGEWKLSNFPVPEVLGYCVPDWTGGGWVGATPYTYGAQLVVALAAPPELRAPLREVVVMDGGGFVDGDAIFDITNILASKVATNASFQYFGAGSDLSNSARVIVANQDVGGWDGNLRTDCSFWDHKYTGVNIPLGAKSTRVFHDANSNSNQVIWVGAVLSVAPLDSDLDGLPDRWETLGYDHNADGLPDLNLAALGANPNRQDVFVEIDYMIAADHSHLPSAAAMQRVINAFAAAPVNNPDGSTGISLHIDTGSGGGGNMIPHQDLLPGVGAGDWTAFDAIKKTNFSPLRAHIYHYVLFAHNMRDGLGDILYGKARNIPGRNLVVSLGSATANVGSETEQAGVFMHELGHNLGLTHGGALSVGSPQNEKPNYLSVMNYKFTQTGLVKSDGSFGIMNYSVFNNPDLDEQHLNETKPIGEPAAFGYITSYYSWGTYFGNRNVSEPIDWNWDGDTLDADVYMEINLDGFREVLKGKTDWDKLSFSGAFQDTFPEKAAGTRPMPSQEELLREPPAKELIKIPPTGPVGLRMEMADGIKLSWFSSGPVTLRNYRVYRVEPNGIRTLLTKIPYKRLPDLERIEVVLPASSASSLDDIYVSAVSWYGYESGLMGHGRRYLPPSQVKFDD